MLRSEQWAYFFREPDLDLVPPALAERPFREALEVARISNFTAWELEIYDQAKTAGRQRSQQAAARTPRLHWVR